MLHQNLFQEKYKVHLIFFLGFGEDMGVGFHELNNFYNQIYC